MYKDGKQYDKFILNGKTYDKFYLNNKQYGGGYVPFATPILDLDFQNNFIDKSPSALTMVQGQGLPTFGLSGRKAGEYCVNFNSLQSIKTTTNLPLNSDKVCIKFWIKTTQYAVAIISEMSSNYNDNNAFIIAMNSSTQNKLDLYDHTSGGSNYNGISTSSDINNGSWIHIIMTINRSLGVSQNKIYVNGQLNFLQSSYVSNFNGNFVNNILFIGQRAGSSVGFNGQIKFLKIFNYPISTTEITNLYNKTM